LGFGELIEQPDAFVGGDENGKNEPKG